MHREACFYLKKKQTKQKKKKQETSKLKIINEQAISTFARIVVPMPQDLCFGTVDHKRLITNSLVGARLMTGRPYHIF